MNIRLILVLFLLLIVSACNKSSSQDDTLTIQQKLQQATLEIQTVNNELLSDDLTFNNENLFSNACCISDLKLSHDTTIMPFEDKKELFKQCYTLVRSFVMDNKEKAVYEFKNVTTKIYGGEPMTWEDIQFSLEWESNVRNRTILPNYTYKPETIGVVTFYVITYTYEGNVTDADFDSIINYNTLLCLQGYPVHRKKVIEQLRDTSKLYEAGKTLFSINQIFPNVYTDEQLNMLLGEEEKTIYAQTGKIFSTNLGSFLWVESDILPELEQRKVDEVSGDSNQVEQRKIYETSEDLPSTPLTDVQQKIITKYDFPEMQMNKQDIYDTFNYNPLVEKMFNKYSKIGLNIEAESYTFHLTDGKIVGISSEVDTNSDFIIKTSWSELKQLITYYKEGNVVAGVPALISLDMPTKVKFEMVSKIKG